MGFATDSMHSYVERDLKKRYPPSEGWKIERQPSWDGVEFDYLVLQRRFGSLKRYPVGVHIVPKVTEREVADFQQKIAALANYGVSIEKMILIVPTEADITAVPDGFDVMYLKVLTVEEGEIVWWRKSALQ